jgi:hypothetical protein
MNLKKAQLFFSVKFKTGTTPRPPLAEKVTE